MYGWSSRHDLRDTGAWDQFGKDMGLILGGRTPVRDIVAFLLAAVPILVGSVLLIEAFLYVARSL